MAKLEQQSSLSCKVCQQSNGSTLTLSKIAFQHLVEKLPNTFIKNVMQSDILK